MKEYPVKPGMDATESLEVLGADMVNWPEKDLREYDALHSRMDKAGTAGDAIAYLRALREMERLWAKHGLVKRVWWR